MKNSDYISFTKSIDLYTEPDSKGKEKLLKKGIRVKQSININDIISWDQIFNSKGTVLKNKCRIYVKDLGPVIVNTSTEEIQKLKDENHKLNKRPSIGFLRKKDK